MLPMRQLALMERFSAVNRMGSRYYDEDKIFYSAKQKIREIMLSRWNGTDKCFSWGLGDEKYHLFSSPNNNDNSRGWDFRNMWVACDAIDYADTGILNENEVSLSMVLFAMNYLTGAMEGDNHILLGKDFKGDIKAKTMELVEELLEGNFFFDEEYKEKKTRDVVDIISNFLISLHRSADGDIERALSDDILVRLCQGLNENMGGGFSDEYILRHIGLFAYPYIAGCPDVKVGLTAIISEELYYYRIYKERLPIKLRKSIDKAISIFEHPMGISYDYDVEDMETENGGWHIILFLTSGDNMDLEDVHLFWKDIRDYLREELPDLRNRYM